MVAHAAREQPCVGIPDQVLGGPALDNVSADFGIFMAVALLTSASATEPVVFTFFLPTAPATGL